MDMEGTISPLSSFTFEGKEQIISFVETMDVGDGEYCDVYVFDGDPSKDLGIIRIHPGGKTPRQRILNGERTIEGYLSGKGKLTITKPDGKQEVYRVGQQPQPPVIVTVGIGEIMQWEADADSDLIAYEICFPPYKDGRYENL
jgi:hypothetical protein